MYKLLLLFALVSVHIQAQINDQFPAQSWTKVRTRMLDGSKDVTEPYLSIRFYQWKFSDNKLCMISEPIFFNPNNCISYKLENNFIRTSPQAGYQIEKLTGDSLIVIERLDGVTEGDKVRKLWFVKTADVRKNRLEKTRNDSVISADEHFTPTLNKNIIVEINQKFAKLNKYPNYNLTGNIVFLPRKQQVKVEIKDTDDVSQYEKYIAIEKSIIEASYPYWNLKDFMHFEKVYLPFVLQSRSNSIDREYTYRGTQIYYFTNNTEDIPKIVGTKPENIRASAKYYSDGISAIQDKKYDKALSYFEKSYETDNRNIDALYNIAAIHSRKNDMLNTCKTLKLLSELQQTEGTKLYHQRCSK